MVFVRFVSSLRASLVVEQELQRKIHVHVGQLQRCDHIAPVESHGKQLLHSRIFHTLTSCRGDSRASRRGPSHLWGSTSTAVGTTTSLLVDVVSGLRASGHW